MNDNVPGGGLTGSDNHETTLGPVPCGRERRLRRLCRLFELRRCRRRYRRWPGDRRRHPDRGFDNGESSASCPSGYLATGEGTRETSQALKLAYAVVGCELLAIAWLRRRYLRVSLAGSLTQVTLAGGLVAAVGVAVGHG